jgi:polyisoprenyl-phosphate glycosyltransferase
MEFTKKISIIIPCYNEEAVLEFSFSRIKKVLLENHLDHHEMLFVNDGSKDGTLAILEKLASLDPAVKIISFSRNFGQQSAISSGINHSTGDVAIIIDADLQDPPELIPEMIKTYLDKNVNVVNTVRKTRKGEGAFKKITASLYYRLLHYLSDTDLQEDTGDFRLIDSQVITSFNRLKEKNKYIRGLICWLGYKQASLYYDREPRFKGETKYSLKKMLQFAGIGLLYFSTKPLSLTVILGFISTLLGLSLGAFFVIEKILHPELLVRGWTSIVTIIIFFGGIQLISIGVLGKYLGSMFDEIKGRPEYIIDKKVNMDV